MGIKFLANMEISLGTVSWLREQGYDVVHLRDEGLQSLPDEEILAKAKRESAYNFNCGSRFLPTPRYQW